MKFIITVILLALLASCDITPNETKQLHNNSVPIYEGSLIRQINIDNCEYIIYAGYTIIHKVNCKNHKSDLNRDYQIDLKNHTALLYDDNRLVGEFIVKDDLSKLILKDNQ